MHNNSVPSWTSRLLDWLGSHLIASHQRIGLRAPFGDFYWRPEDRAIVPVRDTELKDRLLINTLRIRLFERAAWVSTALAFALCVAGMAGLVVLRGAGSVLRSVSAAAHEASLDQELATGDCADLLKRYGTTPLTQAQVAAFNARCRTATQPTPTTH